MPVIGGSVALRRISSYRLVLGTALITALITAALTAALASFAAGALPQATHHQLASASGTSVLVSGAVNAQVAHTDEPVVAGDLHTAFGATPVRITSSRSSDPLGLLAVAGPGPAAPVAGQTGRLTMIAVAATLDGARSQTVLTAGSWPGPPQPGQPVPAAAPAIVAARLHLVPGTVLRLRDRDTGHGVQIRISGIFRAVRPRATYWQLSPAGPGSATVQGTYVTYGPLLTDPAAFGVAPAGPRTLAKRGALASGSALDTGAAAWLAEPRSALIPTAHLSVLAGRITHASQLLTGNGQLGGLAVTTGLPALLLGLSRSGTVATSLLAIGALQLLLLAVAALALAAGLLAGQRESETALLSARGSARWQLARLSGPESALIAVTAAAAGALGGSWLAGRLARSGPLRTAGLRLPASSPGAWWAAGVIGLLSAALLIWPALRPPSPAAARGRRGRPGRVAGFARAGADVALVAVALIAGWQLRRYLAVAPGAHGGLTLDPVLIVAPVLALAAGTVVLLRLLPFAARAGDRAAARGRHLGAAMASWEISRRPVRQGACILLVVLATATATLVLAQHYSWRRSVADQAMFQAGADVRVDLPATAGAGLAGGIAGAPGVRTAMPATNLVDAGTGEVLAVSARQAGSVVLLRPDLAPVSPAALWHPLAAARPAGLPVPGRPGRLAITAQLNRGAATSSPLQAVLQVTDASGASYLLPAGRLPADGRAHQLVATFAGRRASYPLQLTGIIFSYTLPVSKPPDAVLRIGGLTAAASGPGPLPAPFAAGRALAHWISPMAAPGLGVAVQDSIAPGEPKAGPQDPPVVTTDRAGALLRFGPGYGLLASGGPAPPSAILGTLTLAPRPVSGPVPAIATHAYLTANDARVGDTVTVSYGTVSIRAKITAAVSAFPTVTGSDGALLVDLPTLQSVLTSQAAGVLPVAQWWLRTSGPARLPGLPPGTVVTRQQQLGARLLTDPLPDLPQQALPAIALAAVVIAGVGFSVSVTAGVRERRAQSALLAALGVSRASRAGQLCLEQLMLSAPAAVAGVLFGAGLAQLLVPAITLTPNATAPVPPVLIMVPWAQAFALAAAVAAVPVLAAALTIARTPDPAAELRVAEAV
jgi:hypothetical protein